MLGSAIGAAPTLAWEKWETFGHDALAIAKDHFSEVEGELAQRRPYNPNSAGMLALSQAGILHCLSARVAGKLVGYFTWNVIPDLESQSLLIGMQGAWYIDPAYRHGSLGVRMFDESIAHLRRLGVCNAFLHHRTCGAGRGIGRFFRRRGGQLCQMTYSLWIGK